MQRCCTFNRNLEPYFSTVQLLMIIFNFLLAHIFFVLPLRAAALASSHFFFLYSQYTLKSFIFLCFIYFILTFLSHVWEKIEKAKTKKKKSYFAVKTRESCILIFCKIFLVKIFWRASFLTFWITTSMLKTIKQFKKQFCQF